MLFTLSVIIPNPKRSHSNVLILRIDIEPSLQSWFLSPSSGKQASEASARKINAKHLGFTHIFYSRNT